MSLNLDKVPDPGSRYYVGECVGSGSFGHIFTATDLQASNRQVAIKIQKLYNITKPYIEQEYKVLLDLSTHANVPDFYGIYRKENKIWFVMELCEGGSIIDVVNGLLAHNRRMNEEHIAYILKETTKALTFLHDNRVIHRDVKARNIILTRNGEVKLTDFGFSHILDKSVDQTSSCIGSTCWMAPEVIAKDKYDNRVDVWSLGITSIEIGDGQAPYQSMHPTRALFQIVTNPPPTLCRPSMWSETYNDFINECLVKNPEHRPYMAEVIDHPFLTQIPENSYYLTLEIKMLVMDADKLNLLSTGPEVAVIGDHLKYGVDSDLEQMYEEDLASLDKISEDKILDLLEARTKLSQFQTYIGDVLLVINPNEKREIFGEEYHRKYQQKSRSDNAPHVYAVADSAYKDALHHMVSQKIVLAGESGSGKTSTYLHLINHLLYLGENQIINLDRLKGAIKLIHSLTHASTPINSYSTRCIFETEIKFGNTGKVSGAIFHVYQLEKWRVSSVDMVQGNFHFLYYIYDGIHANKKLEKYHLKSDREYRYLRIRDKDSEGPKVQISQNLVKFKTILKVFEDFGIEDNTLDTIFNIVAAILSVGEIRFQQSDDGDAIIKNPEILANIANLLKIDSKKFAWALTNSCIIQNSSAVRKKNSVSEARDARDIFANNLYSRMVDYIVALINDKLSIGRSIFGEKYSIKIYDYFGFECFKTNHLPQLFVNCLNEQLQYHYLQRVFSWECLDVETEGIPYQHFHYYHNKDTLDHLLSKSGGLFSMIDEASKTGRGPQHVIDFLKNLESKYVKVIGTSEFAVAHYTGNVSYNINEMPHKNRDILQMEIIETLQLSEHPIIKMLFTNKLDKIGTLIISFNNEQFEISNYKPNQYSQMKEMRTCTNIFKAMSLKLLKDLSVGSGSGGTHFIRCLRSHLKKEPGSFSRELIKQQIRALAVTETAKARKRGYPHRIPFSEFLRRYQFLAFDFNENVEVTKDNCRLLLIRLKMEGWAIGKSKVFLKYYNEEYLSRLYETQVKKIIKIQSILRRFLAKCSVAKKIKETEIEPISKITTTNHKKITEEEAAAIIQKAYRESSTRKSYIDFAKDYAILDENTCNFIRSFANKWRKNSIFHVLLQYRALRFQDSFNFSQQVHLYNIGVFYDLQEIDIEISLETIDTKAQVTHWLGENKLTLRKIPFRLEDIPFYDTSHMCTSNLQRTSRTSLEKDDSWDVPYKWRELIGDKVKKPTEELIKNEESLIYLPFNRDPETPMTELKKNIETEEVIISPPKLDFVSKIEKNSQNNQIGKMIITKSNSQKQIDDDDLTTKPANKDFDYMRTPVVSKGKSGDPIAELKKIGVKEDKMNDDDPPFNFQGMLRKTNYRKEQEQKEQVNTGPVYTLKKTQSNDTENEIDIENKIEGKNVTVELDPGIVLEGIEVEL